MELFCINANINRWPDQSGIPEKRIKGADEKNRRLLPFFPLEWIITVICRDWKEALPIISVIAFKGIQVDGARDIAFVRMAIYC